MYKKLSKEIFSKIGFKLLAPYLTISFFSLCLLGGILYFSYQIQSKSFNDVQEEIARNTAGEIQLYISNITKELNLLSKNIACIDDCADDTNNFLIQNFISQNPSLNEISIASKDGQEKYKINRYNTGLSSELHSVPDQERFLGGLKSDVYISDVLILENDLPCIFISVPVFNKTNNKVGVIMAEVDLSPLWGIISKVKIRSTGYVYIVDSKGQLIAYKDISLVKSKLDLKNIKGVQNFFDNKEGFGTYKSFTGENVLGSWQNVNTVNWGLIVELPTKEIFKDNVVVFMIGAISIALSLLFVVIIIYVIYKNLLIPLKSIQEGVDAIGEGDLNVKLKITKEMVGNEIGKLSETFNIMTSELKESYESLETKVQERTLQLDEKVKEVSRSNSELEKSKADILKLLNDIEVEKGKVDQLVIERTKELRAEKSRLLASINSIPFGFIVADADNHILLKNNVITSMLHLEDTPVTSLQEIGNFLGQGFDLNSAIMDCERGKKICEIKKIVFQSKIFRGIVAPIANVEELGEIIGYVFILEDITEAKALERSRDEFFSIASHELRTPLTAIKGNSEMIQDMYKDKIVDADMSEMIADIHDASARLIGIVNDFLDMSRLEQSKISFVKETVDVTLLIQKTCKEMEPMAKLKNLELIFEQPQDVIPPISTDLIRIKQVISNVIDNAIKYTHKGSVRVHLEKIENMLAIHVSDTGQGISEENQHLLFRKFQQAGDNILARDVSKSTGLGLYIARLVTEALGGTVVLSKSVINEGSTFTITLPITTP